MQINRLSSEFSVGYELSLDSEKGRGEVRVERHSNYGKAGFRPATVNWSAFGPVNPLIAAQYGQILVAAAELASKLDDAVLTTYQVQLMVADEYTPIEVKQNHIAPDRDFLDLFLSRFPNVEVLSVRAVI